MKFIVPFVCLLLFACESSNKKETDKIVADPLECDCKELQYNSSYNVYHRGDPKAPYSGTCYLYHPGGILKEVRTTLNGKYEGAFITYYKDGALKSSTKYKNGLTNGVQKLYNRNGQLTFHGIYKMNKLVETISIMPLKPE